MAYDAEVEVNARERVMQLRDFLAALPQEKLRMGGYIYSPDLAPECGTQACIAGWAYILFVDPDHRRAYQESRNGYFANTVGEVLGMSLSQYVALFWPPHYLAGITTTPAQAARVLDHYLNTNKIDWSVA